MNGLFGKRKDIPETTDERSTITTVSSTYQRNCEKPPVATPRISKDQQEFDEALGTLARRRKYTVEGGSRYSSSLTVNGDPARIYEGCPQDTTTSIMGDLTPKAPARRFGQVSPRPTDKIPPLNYDDKEPKENGTAGICEKAETTPVPPLRRFGNRSSQRLNACNPDSEEEANTSNDMTLRDENENVPEDYVFKRFSQDAVRRSNLSINSCNSVTSTTSTYGRKKRRAPQPPVRREQLETRNHPQFQECDIKQTAEAPKIELQIVEPIDITKVTENIDEMTKKSEELNAQSSVDTKEETETENDTKNVTSENAEGSTKHDTRIVSESSKTELMSIGKEITVKSVEHDAETAEQSKRENTASKPTDDVEIEYRRTSHERLEIVKDVDQTNSPLDQDEVCLRRKNSSEALPRCDSFSVKEEIEKIEKQIKALEMRNASKDSADEGEEEGSLNRNTRLSIQANRRHFFENMVDSKNELKIEFKELPREQTDIRVVKLTDPPVPVDAPEEPVKVIELHISEPIRQKPELLEDVNPIPKPRRHTLNGSDGKIVSREEHKLAVEKGKSFSSFY